MPPSPSAFHTPANSHLPHPNYSHNTPHQPSHSARPSSGPDPFPLPQVFLSRPQTTLLRRAILSRAQSICSPFLRHRVSLVLARPAPVHHAYNSAHPGPESVSPTPISPASACLSHRSDL